MKTTPPPAKKAAKEPRLDCRQRQYSESALLMMEQATGQRFARAVQPVKPPEVPAEEK